MPTAPTGTSPAPTATDRTTMPWWGLATLATAAFTAVLTELLPAGLLVQLGTALRVSSGQAGLLVTAYALAAVLSAIPVTAALRGLPRRPVLIATLTGFGLLNAVTALSSSYPLTLAARLGAGVAAGTMWAMLAGYAARMVPAHRRGRAVAIVLAGITVALAAGIPAGTAVAGALGWRTGFAALAVMAALLVVGVRLAVPPLPGEPPVGRVPLRRVATLPGIRAVLLVTALLLLGHQVLYTYLAPFAQRAGIGPGLALLAFGATTVAGVTAAGTLADRHLRATLLAALAAIAAALLVLGPLGQHPAVLLGAAALWGVAFGAAPTLLQTALVDASGTATADVATSLQATVHNLGIAAGSLTGGLVLDGVGVAALPWVAAALVAAATGSVAAAHRAFPRRRLTA